MNFFQSLGKALASFLTSPRAKAVEAEILVEALPLAEAAVSAVAKTNPVVSVAITVLEPVINKELGKLQ